MLMSAARRFRAANARRRFSADAGALGIAGFRAVCGFYFSRAA
jgi:hypothetical protein